MRRLFLVAFVAACAALAPRAEAAFAPIVATIVGQPTIDGFGVTYTVGGGATMDLSGPFPVITAPVDSVTPSGSGFLFAGSGVVEASIPGLTAGLTLSDSVLDTFAGTLSALIVVPDFAFSETLVFALLEPDGDLAISADAAGLLAMLGIRGAEGFVIANLVFEPSAIPLPASFALFGAGLLGLAAARRRGAPRCV